MFTFAAKTACGALHDRNDDRVYAVDQVLHGAEEPGTELAYESSVDGPRATAAVFDGVSSSHRGDLAASAAAVSLLNSGVNPEMTLEQRLQECAFNAYDVQKDLARDDRGYTAGAGVEILSTDAINAVARPFHVGDCRTYLFREGQLSRLTKDHSLAQDFIEKNGEDIPVPADIAHIITRVLGDATDYIDIDEALICQEDDIFLCCSDGLWEYISIDFAQQVLENCNPKDPASLASVLASFTKVAVFNGSPDDVSSVLLSWSPTYIGEMHQEEAQ